MAPTKLDKVWMEALGFRLMQNGVVGTQWRNDDFSIQVRDDDPVSEVVRRWALASRRKVEAEGKRKLQEALLDAMGLDIITEYDQYGSTKRAYVGEN